MLQRWKSLLNSYVSRRPFSNVSKKHARVVLSRWLMSENLVKFGKVANAVLRHDARKLELEIRPDGYMRVQDVLKAPLFKNTNLDTFLKLVKRNPIHFSLRYEPDGEDLDTLVTWVKANKGHTIPGIDTRLERILSHGPYSTANYPTPERTLHNFLTAAYPAPLDSWQWIRTHGIPPGPDGLIRLSTKSISIIPEHTVSFTRPSEVVQDGTQAIAPVFISVYISIQKTLSSGIKLYLTKTHDEILSTGDRNGVLPPNLFTAAVEIKTESEVLMEEGSS